MAFHIEGDQHDKDGQLQTEDVKLWHHNPVECIKELMGNPAFKRKQCYAPQKVYKNVNRINRKYSKMWTADWWWNLQVVMKLQSLEEDFTHIPFFIRKYSQMASVWKSSLMTRKKP